MLRYKKWIATLVLGVALGVCSAASAKDSWERPWLPEGVSSYSKDIDSLFYFILGLTTFVFICTEGALIVFLVKYRKKEGEKSFYTHGNHKLEMIWTITPAVVLIVIALIQAKTWSQIKDSTSFPDKNSATIDDYVHVQLFAEQYQWTFRYPAIVTEKDMTGVNREVYKYGVNGTFTEGQRLTVPKGKPIIVEMTSKDVIHSFFLPYMRLKQDVVPGMQIRVWFDANKSTEEMRVDRPQMVLTDPKGKPQDLEWDYPIMCAELCGIQHYNMWGRVIVLEQKEYDAWRKAESKKAMKDADGNSEKPEAEVFAKYWEVNPETQARIYGKSKESQDTVEYNKRTALENKTHEK